MLPTLNEAVQCSQTLIHSVVFGIISRNFVIKVVVMEWGIYILTQFPIWLSLKTKQETSITIKTKSKQGE